MTDDLDPRDELASAHLDGATSPEEDALVAADPDLAARVEALAAVRRAVAAGTGPVDGTRRDAAIAAALAAAEPTPVVELDAARRARRRTQLLGVAAALVLAGAIAAGVRSRHDHHSTSTTAAAAPKAADRAASAPEDLGRASATTTTVETFATTGGSTGAMASGAITVVELGAYPDLPALAGAVRQQLLGHAAAPLPAAPPVAAAAVRACLPPDASAEPSVPPTFLARATLGGRPVVVVVVDQGGRERLTALTPAPDCAAVGSTEL